MQQKTVVHSTAVAGTLRLDNTVNHVRCVIRWGVGVAVPVGSGAPALSQASGSASLSAQVHRLQAAPPLAYTV
eukprot:1346353-Prymnesium_polylepis.3